MSRPDRLHIALGLLVALGVGWRAVDSEMRPGNQPDLESHLSLVDSARGAQRAPATRRASKPVAATSNGAVKRATKRASGAQVVERAGAVATPPSGEMRRESTPLSVVAPGGLKYVRGAADAVDPGIIVDVEAAGVRQLEALPRVGPALARRIVEDRDKHGPFRDLQGLQRVKGIGPKLAARLAQYVTFGPTGRPLTGMPTVRP